MTATNPRRWIGHTLTVWPGDPWYIRAIPTFDKGLWPTAPDGSVTVETRVAAGEYKSP